jgi:hypothetical protein
MENRKKIKGAVMVQSCRGTTGFFVQEVNQEDSCPITNLSDKSKKEELRRSKNTQLKIQKERRDEDDVVWIWTRGKMVDDDIQGTDRGTRLRRTSRKKQVSPTDLGVDGM